MKASAFFGKLISIKFKDRNTPIQGLCVDFNEDWTLLKYNPQDFLVDGYLIFRNKNLEGYRRAKAEKFVEKVIKLKGVAVAEENKIPLEDLASILAHLTEKYGVFSLELKSENACYPGRLKSIDSKTLVIEYLNTKGKWKGTKTFRPGDIRIIEFDTDYLNSLMLLSKK